MAIVKKNVLGRYSGKIGDVVAYERHGKQILARLPLPYTTKSPLVKEGRRKFAAINNFVIPIYKSSKLISLAWKKGFPDYPLPFHKMVSENSKFFQDGLPGLRNLVTPDSGEMPFSRMSFDGRKIRINFAEVFPGTLLTFMVPFNPVIPETADFIVLPLHQLQVSGVESIIDLKNTDLEILQSFSNYLCFAAVISEECWTNTFAIAGEL